MNLINRLIKQRYLKTPEIIKAFRKIKRTDFVLEKDREIADEYNAPLDIGVGQTISQPLTVAFMLELLQPKKGHKILDIGSGSGWQTALLCEIAGESGFVYAIERIRKLKEFGQNNAAKYSFENVEFIYGDGSKGLPDKAPFDRIIVAASGDKIPETWKKQLKTGGRLVAPAQNSIFLIIRKKKNEFIQEEYRGFVFVPLVKEKEKKETI